MNVGKNDLNDKLFKNTRKTFRQGVLGKTGFMSNTYRNQDFKDLNKLGLGFGYEGQDELINKSIIKDNGFVDQEFSIVGRHVMSRIREK